MIHTPKQPPTNAEISLQLERILVNPGFNAMPRQISFLKYVVNQALIGNADEINEHNAAAAVFDRGPEFDSRVDPVVDIQAGILRRGLVRYYDTAGRYDPVRITIPANSFVPVFENRPAGPPIDTASDGQSPDFGVDKSLPSVLVRPLRNLSGHPEIEFWGIGLATELADELNRYPDIQVMTLGRDTHGSAADERAAWFVVDGSVRSDGSSIKMIVNLTETRTGLQIWSESSRPSIKSVTLNAFQEKLAKSIAAKIAGERGLIMKTLDQNYGRRAPTHSKVYEALLRYYEYDVTYSPESFSRALIELENAVIIDPDYAPAWSGLSRVYGDIYAFGMPGFKDPLEKAFEYAQKGVRLSPTNQRSRVALGYIHLFRNDLEAGLAEAERALMLGPDTLFMLDGIGYLMMLLGAWQRGYKLIQKVIRLNPFYGNYVHYALWGRHLAQKNYEDAYREALNLSRRALFWDHLARAATHGLLGNIEDGRIAAAELLRLKPDFAARGRILIGNFIKFEIILNRIIKGLGAVGIEVQ